MSNFRLLVSLVFLGVLAAWSSSNMAAEAPKRGMIQGGVEHAVPAWFKDSFLEIDEDVEEAADADKHVLLFFKFNGCPYCDRMLSEIFESEPHKSFIQKHFDVIAINIKGDQDIALNEEVSLTEKELSEKLNVWATPGIIFLNQDNKSVVRVDGYRAPARFKHIMEYVSSKAYETQKLSAYLEHNLSKTVYSLRADPMFKDISDLSSVKGPLALIFEDTRCSDCEEFHDIQLANPDVRKEMSVFTVVRLDAESDTPVVDVEGNRTTAKALAKALSMTYRPGVVLYDDGNLLHRYDSLLYSFHFKEGFRWIGSGAYKTEDLATYSARRTEELLAAGININLDK